LKKIVEINFTKMVDIKKYKIYKNVLCAEYITKYHKKKKNMYKIKKRIKDVYFDRHQHDKNALLQKKVLFNDAVPLYVLFEKLNQVFLNPLGYGIHCFLED